MTDGNRTTERISSDRLRELIETYNLQCFRGDTALALEELERLRHYVATCGGTDNDGRCPMHHLAGVRSSPVARTALNELHQIDQDIFSGEPSANLLAVKRAADALVAYIGCHGEINSRHALVLDCLEALNASGPPNDGPGEEDGPWAEGWQRRSGEPSGDAEDAARYRWLRAQMHIGGAAIVEVLQPEGDWGNSVTAESPDGLDTAVDAARLATTKSGDV